MPRVLIRSGCPCSRAPSRPSTRASSPSPPPRIVLHCSLPLRPRRHSSCQRYPCLQAPSDLNASLVSFPLRALLVRAPDVLVSLLFSLHGLLLYHLQALLPPKLPAVVTLRFPFVAPRFLSRLVLCSLPRVSPSPSSLRPLNAFHPVC